MEFNLGPLFPLLNRERSAGRAMALGILLDTAGSTYARPGALLLIAQDGEYAGLISGGCLEGDLAEHAQAVIDSGEARRVNYDLRNPDDLVWGLGSGCEGAMHILLVRVGPVEDWQPLEHLSAAFAAGTPTAIGIVTESHDTRILTGSCLLPDSDMSQLLPSLERRVFDAASHAPAPGWFEDPGRCRVFLLPLIMPPRLLLLGAGPDARPVCQFAAQLYWQVTLADHRPAFAVATRFPAAERLVIVRPEALSESLDLARFHAAVVMSHHLESDREYLRALARSELPYVGLLGPAARRDKLLAQLGSDAQRLRTRLRAPVGLDLGGRAPPAIALSIVAEILEFLQGRSGGAVSSSREAG